MARTAGITQEQVNLVAAELRGQGITPGVRNVREKLGTGSNQTIQAMLQNWQKALPMPVATADMPLEALPPELVQVLQAALAGAKAGVATEYQDAIAVAYAQRDRATQDALTQYDEFERQCKLAKRLGDETMELHGKNDELAKQIAHLTERDAQRESLRESAENKAAAAEARVSMLEPKVQELEAAAKAAAEAHTEALHELRAAHTDALAKAQAESKAAATVAAEAHDKTKQALAESAAALTEAKAQGASMGTELKNAQATISSVSAKLEEALKSAKASEEKATAVAVEFATAKGQIAELREQAKRTQTLQEQIAELREQAKRAQTLQEQVSQLQRAKAQETPQKGAQA